jgi:hypothetical protein
MDLNGSTWDESDNVVLSMNGVCRGPKEINPRWAKNADVARSPMRRLLAILAILMLASPCLMGAQVTTSEAQMTGTNSPSADTAQSGNAQQSPDDSQQPGAGAQVHTGTASGLDTQARLDNLLADHQFPRIEDQLDQLPAKQAQFYRGILANRNNDLKQSVALLEPLVDEVTASGNLAHENLLRKALAEDYLREGDWAKAANAYQQLETRLGATMSSDERDEIEMPLKLLPLAKDHPPMTVGPCDPFEMQVSQNPLGLTDIPVFVDARPHSWMLDPTAPFNLIAHSLAKDAGLTLSADAVTIHTLTGRPIQVHATVIPRFTIGGQLTLHNMTAFVYEDADYYFPQTRYQVEGVLGYPALEALGRVTVTGNDTVFIQPNEARETPAEKERERTSGVRFFLDGDQVIVALGAAVGGEERMYAIDAGGQQTYLTSRYYDEHTADFANQRMQLLSLRSQAVMAPVPAFTAETVPLTVGTMSVDVHFIPVLTQPLGSAALDDIYGLLGVNALDQFGSYTFDYRTMRFSVMPQGARD